MKNLFKNIGTPNSAKTTRIIRSVQATAVTLSASTFALSKPELGFYLLVAAGAADVILSAFDNGETQQKNGNSSKE